MEKVNNVMNNIKQGGIFILKSFNQLMWPAICLNCRTIISDDDNRLCQDCWDELLSCAGSDYCRRCGRDAVKYGLLDGSCPDCQGKKIMFDGIARAGVYEHALSKLILSFKNGRTELESVLGFLANSALQGCEFIDEIDVFIPVPLHWTRRFSRGYNQSHLLVKGLKQGPLKISTDFVRIRRTKLQPAMASPAAREKNVAGAFAVRYGHKFDGTKICLVDDIKTTGATLNECAKTMKKAGASKVFALVLAVAGQKV